MLDAQKYEPIDTISLDEARTVLRMANNRNSLGIAETVRALDCDGKTAGDVLNALARRLSAASGPL